MPCVFGARTRKTVLRSSWRVCLRRCVKATASIVLMLNPQTACPEFSLPRCAVSQAPSYCHCYCCFCWKSCQPLAWLGFALSLCFRLQLRASVWLRHGLCLTLPCFFLWLWLSLRLRRCLSLRSRNTWPPTPPKRMRHTCTLSTVLLQGFLRDRV